MKYKLFGQNKLNARYKLALLIKESALREKELRINYIEPLKARGFKEEDIIAIGLPYNEQNKAPTSLIKEFIGRLEPVCSKYSIRNLLVADAPYFKVIAKVRKTDNQFGYALPSVLAGVQSFLTINYQQLFYQPQLKSRLEMGLDAVARAINGQSGMFQQDLLQNCSFPETKQDIETALNDLLDKPALTCDIETLGLELSKSRLLSIAFAESEYRGVAFLSNSFSQLTATPDLLKEFFEQYKGKFIYHNATFDIGRLVHQLFMRDIWNYKGMLEGLHIMFRDMEDTKILAYLATNSTTRNNLQLKHQAFEFIGNYALDMKDPSKIARDKLKRYNMSDALATWYVYNKYYGQVQQEQKQVYENLFKPALKVITQMELVGMPLNYREVLDVNTELSQISTSHLEAILAHPAIKHFEARERVEQALLATSKLKKTVKTAADYADLQFNPRSHKQLQKLLYDQLELPITQYTDKGQPSTSGKTINGLINWLKQTYEL
jgi:DNA polymerase-1